MESWWNLSELPTHCPRLKAGLGLFVFGPQIISDLCDIEAYWFLGPWGARGPSLGPSIEMYNRISARRKERKIYNKSPTDLIPVSSLVFSQCQKHPKTTSIGRWFYTNRFCHWGLSTSGVWSGFSIVACQSLRDDREGKIWSQGLSPIIPINIIILYNYHYTITIAQF